MTVFHIDIMREPYLTLALDGRKYIESRFGVKRMAPYGRIFSENIVYLKMASGPVLGRGIVHRVEEYADLVPDMVADIFADYGVGLLVEPDFIQSKLNSRYAVLVWLKDVVRTEPWPYHKRDQRNWLVFEEDPAPANISST